MWEEKKYKTETLVRASEYLEVLNAECEKIMRYQVSQH